MAQENYYPKRQKELEIPEFLQNKEQPSGWSENAMNAPVYPNLEAAAAGVQENINSGIAQVSHERENHYHFKELDKQADAYTEDEAKVIVKRLVSNYPDIVLTEVAELIKDMQELSGVILQNSSIFAKKRGAV